MLPNIIMVHPPSTDSGRLEKKFPIGGSNPAKIMHNAPMLIVKRLTTCVIATSPTFWLNDVTGGHPKIADNALQNPSHASAPLISFSSISRPRPLATTAVESPIVSAARNQENNRHCKNGTELKFRHNRQKFRECNHLSGKDNR